MHIILIGPPGSGKGTQADRICHAYNLFYVASGSLIRDEIAHHTKLGETAQGFMQKGELVPDEIIMSMIQKATNHKGLLLDGFPRSLTQAQTLSKLIDIHAVIALDVSDESVIKRLASRRMVHVGNDEHTFASESDAQLFMKLHGGTMFTREDDTPATIAHRLEVYHAQTQPVLDYYGKQHITYLINGEKSVDEVTRNIHTILSRLHTKLHE
jgi:adenylate kinase